MAELIVNKYLCKNPYDEGSTHDYDIKSKSGFTYDFKWEGVVLQINEDSIVSRLIESSTNEEDELILPLSKVSKDDINLLEEGALFNFYVGYSNSNGTIKKADVIKFRRKAIIQDDINDILDSLKEIDFDDLLEEY